METLARQEQSYYYNPYFKIFIILRTLKNISCLYNKSTACPSIFTWIKLYCFGRVLERPRSTSGKLKVHLIFFT